MQGIRGISKGQDGMGMDKGCGVKSTGHEIVEINHPSHTPCAGDGNNQDVSRTIEDKAAWYRNNRASEIIPHWLISFSGGLIVWENSKGAMC